MNLKILVLTITVSITLAHKPQPPVLPDPPGLNCGYQSCHPVKEGYINVHIVPHTHDDVGWLKTVDQYYYGSKNTIQNAGVQYILDSVVEALYKDKSRRFIYVETAYFWKWWIHQHDIVKSRVRKFVKNGQLEFVSGGWSMNDEAVTNYQSIIDQMTWGLRKLNESFGECGRPKMGWQIDPFGHSREMASIFAQLGFDGILLGRIDYQDKQFRMKSKTAEMVWRGSANLGNSTEIFTGVMFNTYSPPSGFCFDILCNDEPIIDDKKSPEYNVDKRVDQFFDHVKNLTEVYATNNVIVTMGEDFNYQDADTWFKNLDKLILYANQRQANGSKYHLIYSTPSCYVKAIHDETKGKIKWPVKSDDFFPYASDPHAFWTGYFTSRPAIKRFERVGNNFLQVCKQLYALTDLGPEDRVDLDALREAMGVMQHHDAITGTEKQHVANDYARILSQGIEECSFITATALSKLIDPLEKNFIEEEPAPAIPFSSCPLLNISQCESTENKNSFIVTIYNPLSKPVSKIVRVPVTSSSFSVRDPTGQELQTQIVPIPEPVKKIPGRNSTANVELIFEAADIPPLGFRSYFVQSVGKQQETKTAKLRETGFLVDPKTGSINTIVMNNIEFPLTQEFLYYEGFVGDNAKFINRSSGAYIFRPIGEAKPFGVPTHFDVHTGNLVAEIHQEYNEYISQVIRVYSGQGFIEFDWIVGPIPNSDQHGKEIITRYNTKLESNSTFFTDSNGREMIKRIRNFRPTWQLDLKEPVAGNYYPVTSKIVLKDNDMEMAVVTDRAQGGSSLEDGQLELMLHRSCVHDDAFGVGEALVETAFDKGLVVRGSHYVIVGSANGANPDGKTTAAQERDLQHQKLLSTWTFFSPSNGLTFEQYKAKYKMEYSGLKRKLPDNVKILTLEPWKGTSFLLRLEHIFENNEDPTLSQPVSIDLKGLFTPFEIVSLQETTLGANQWLKDNERLNFDTSLNLEYILLINKYKSFNDTEKENMRKWLFGDTDLENRKKRATLIEVPDEDPNSLIINLKPMQIRTFVIEIKKSDI